MGLTPRPLLFPGDCHQPKPTAQENLLQPSKRQNKQSVERRFELLVDRIIPLEDNLWEQKIR